MITQFINYLEIKGYSPLTISAYRTDLNNFFNELFTTYRNEPQPVKRWAQGLQGEPATINRRIAAIKSYYTYCKRAGLSDVDHGANLAFRKKPKRLPYFHTNMDEILAQPLTEMERAVITTFYETGIRLSELTSLQTKNIAPGTIKVLGKGNKERIIPITPGLYLKLLRVANPEGLVFNLTNRQVQHLVKRITGMSPHKLRHTFATALIRSGASVLAIKELLGHASVNSTQVYTHVNIDHLKAVHAKAHPRERK